MGNTVGLDEMALFLLPALVALALPTGGSCPCTWQHPSARTQWSCRQPHAEYVAADVDSVPDRSPAP